MALERKDNIGDTTTSTGTGTINLDAVAQSGSRIFAGNVTSGSTVRYDIRSTDNSEWEIGEGVFTDGAPDTLTRVTVYASSNSNNLVSFSAGTKSVSLIFSANDLVKATKAEAATGTDLDKIIVPYSIAGLFSLAEGEMLNGKIVVTDTGSGITVALKGKDGNDPSATNPVYAMIGGTLRTVTAALSKTLADGTNWFDSGNADLATLEIDYFVYLGYNATDGVVLGFSRIPFARQYSDFSATTTSEKYCAISTITTAASTDYYNVIGRFAATLSAGAGYTWSVPTYTAINLIQRPIYETRLLTWAPVWTGYSASPSGTALYQVVGQRVFLFMEFISGTSNANTNKFTVPFAPTRVSEQRQMIGMGFNSGANTGPHRLNLDTTRTFSWSLDKDGNVWATSGNKYVQVPSGFSYLIN